MIGSHLVVPKKGNTNVFESFNLFNGSVQSTKHLQRTVGSIAKMQSTEQPSPHLSKMASLNSMQLRKRQRLLSARLCGMAKRRERETARVSSNGFPLDSSICTKLTNVLRSQPGSSIKRTLSTQEKSFARHGTIANDVSEFPSQQAP